MHKQIFIFFILGFLCILSLFFKLTEVRCCGKLLIMMFPCAGILQPRTAKLQDGPLCDGRTLSSLPHGTDTRTPALQSTKIPAVGENSVYLPAPATCQCPRSLRCLIFSISLHFILFGCQIK